MLPGASRGNAGRKLEVLEARTLARTMCSSRACSGCVVCIFVSLYMLWPLLQGSSGYDEAPPLLLLSQPRGAAGGAAPRLWDAALRCNLDICRAHDPKTTPRLFINEFTGGAGNRLKNIICGMGAAVANGMNFGGVVARASGGISVHGKPWPMIVDGFLGQNFYNNTFIGRHLMWKFVKDRSVREVKNLHALAQNRSSMQPSDNVYLNKCEFSSGDDVARFLTPSLQAELTLTLSKRSLVFAQGRLAVAVHLRRGDRWKAPAHKHGDDVLLSTDASAEDAYYYGLIDIIRRAEPLAEVHAWSSLSGNWTSADFDGYRSRGVQVHLDADSDGDAEELINCWAQWTQAHVFLSARSTMSMVAVMLNPNCVVLAPAGFDNARVPPRWMFGKPTPEKRLAACIRQVWQPAADTTRDGQVRAPSAAAPHRAEASEAAPGRAGKPLADPALAQALAVPARAEAPRPAPEEVAGSPRPPSAKEGLASTRVRLQNHYYRHEQSRRDRAAGERSSACARHEEDPLFTAGLDQSRYPWHPAVRERRRPSVLWGTAHAQKAIWDHQHPADCSRAIFMQWTHHRAGIGATLHVMSRALAYAMRLGRVFVFAKKDRYLMWRDRNFCPDAPAWECWFLPVAGCAARPEATLNVSYEDLKAAGEELARSHPHEDAHSLEVPPQFRGALSNCSPVRRDAWFHWWRAQAMTYVIRFNEKTRGQVDRLAAEVLQLRRLGGQAAATAAPRITSLEPGSVSLHVRHGDKGREMKLVAFKEYLQLAERLAEGDQDLQVMNQGTTFDYPHCTVADPPDTFRRRVMFVSTEDQQVIDEALNSTGLVRNAWDVAYVETERKNTCVFCQRGDKGVEREVLESLLNLELALQADAWIGTLRSNWCRLIDELRMTIGAKAGSPYLNLPSGDHAIPDW
ncbi:unnamed protein product [Prorocentrum cordatum]|uniref:Uncharacterized protein n=1 Tax=Prorocentrum cordatum TaxID=2364126 RepID=A0ABN9QYB3_9DINO|nr:unnamed protein product [Polarella glacialis]